MGAGLPCGRKAKPALPPPDVLTAKGAKQDFHWDLENVTPVQLAAVHRLQRNARGSRDRHAIATRQSILHHYDKQEALGEFRKRFMIASNKPENDAHWDSDDPKWVGRSSMSKRHRFLIRRDWHWRWFNALVFGMMHDDGTLVAPNDCSADAVSEVKLMRRAALHYVDTARPFEHWSDNVGLFFHVYGHNSVNSMHLHIVDLDFVGGSFHQMAHKNCPLDAVLEVLLEAETNSMNPSAEKRSPAAMGRSPAHGSRDSRATSDSRATNGPGPPRRQRTRFMEKTTLKSTMNTLNPRINDVATFKEARASLWRMGGPDVLRETLEVEGFLKAGSPMLTTGVNPFNVFARLAWQDSAARILETTFSTSMSARHMFVDTSVSLAEEDEHIEYHWV
mmetsp:Transcript_70469/g.158377  ORF Transcript_70469/g.158377 Transcript_70469/m.158377 type:complete len:391 (-) Transcript_70469:51-1223(-)